MSTQSSHPLNLPPQKPAGRQNIWITVGVILTVVMCICGIAILVLGGRISDTLFQPDEDGQQTVTTQPGSASLVIAVSPSMAPTLESLAQQFNSENRQTPDGQTMVVHTEAVDPLKMVEESLAAPEFQAISPDSSLWLNQLERAWTTRLTTGEEAGAMIPIANRRTGVPVRYAVSPVVIAAWESVALELSWPQEPVGWQQIQQKATRDPDFKWNHPSTNNASGLLATLAEFYAGAGLTRALTEEAATDQVTIDYVRAVEATIRFYGEGEDVIVERLAVEGRAFLDAFVAQEQTVIAWNQGNHAENLVAIYPAEGTLWADHPLALLELGGPGETPVTDNQRRTYQAFVEFITSSEAQRQLLRAGFRPADLSIDLVEESGSPFAHTTAIDWRQPQTTLQMPSAHVIEVVQNVWWYTKRPTNVYLVVDTSGSMEGEKLARTQEALLAFVAQIQGDRDRVGLIEFGSGVKSTLALQGLDTAGRDTLNQTIAGLQARGNTALLDAVWEAYLRLTAANDPEAINAIVVMTDGRENASDHTLEDLRQRFANSNGTPVVVFTIGFGSEGDLDDEMLETIARIGGGQYRRADETSIEELYKVISTYF
ncbi:MAG: VWA domain-containing protein [Anaerolineae bacterium]|nr:VWA domain-containing protein [Anaerolineae bacterium]